MLTINKGDSNDLVLTLKERSILPNPTYLFEFENEQTHVKSYCLTTDISTDIERYNEFIITEQSSPDPLQGEVSLTEGNYLYTIYEQTSTTNLSPTGLDEVETGYLKVKDATSFVNTYYSGAEVNNTAYEG